jgi:hypothetical protein
MKTPAVLSVLGALALAAPAGAAVQTVPMSDPNVAVSSGSSLATLFTNLDPGPQTVRLNTNQNWVATVTDGSACPLVSIRRGTSRLSCSVPAGGSVFYSGRTVGGSVTYTTAFSLAGAVLGNVSYLTTPAPFIPTVYTITCAYKGWGYYLPPPGCPPIGA